MLSYFQNFLFTFIKNACDFFSERKQYIKHETIFIAKYDTYIGIIAVQYVPLLTILIICYIKGRCQEAFSVSDYVYLLIFFGLFDFIIACFVLFFHIVIKEDVLIERYFLVKKREVRISDIKECGIRPIKRHDGAKVNALVIGDMNGNELWVNLSPYVYHRKDLKTLVTKLSYPDAIKYKEESPKKKKARKRKQRRETARWALNIFIASSICLVAGALVMFVLVRVLKIDYFNDWLGHVLGLSAIFGGYRFSSIVKNHTKKVKLRYLFLCAIILVLLIVMLVVVFRKR